MKKAFTLVFLMFTSLFFLLALKDNPAQQQNNTSALLEYEKNTVDVFQKNVSSVVNISNINVAHNAWTFDAVEIPAGAGSGFVWSGEGHIITNYHVAQAGDSFLVSFHGDEKQYRAKLVGADPFKDIAVLKLEEMPSRLFPIQVGESKNLLIGQKAIAIGNPFGLDSTVTVGIISAINRKIDGIGGVKIHGMIQTDASINPGNSGGALIDSSGKLIGMNTMIYSGSGTSSGVGFAVPVDLIKRIVPQLIKHGKVVRPGLGIGIMENPYNEGLLITYIKGGGPADRAGLEGMRQDNWGRRFLGDTILAVDGKKVNTYDDIYNVLEAYNIGDTVEVTYQRQGKIKKTRLQLSQAQ